MERSLFFCSILLTGACTPLQTPFPESTEDDPSFVGEEPSQTEANEDDADEETALEDEPALDGGFDAAAKVTRRDASQNRTDGAVARRADAAVSSRRLDAAAAPAKPPVTGDVTHPLVVSSREQAHREQ